MLTRIAISWIVFATLMGFALGGSFVWALPPPPHSQQEAPAEQKTNTTSTQSHQTKSLWIPEDSTGFFTLWLAVFTGVLALSTIFLWRSTRDAAIAGQLNAEALISAERAHIVVVVTSSNLYDALMGVHLYDSAAMTTAKIPIPSLEFTIKNTGRTAAILSDISYQLVQTDADNVDWRFVFKDTIVNPVLEGGQQSAPDTPCSVDSVLDIGDGRAIANGDRPLFFYGFVTFRDMFKRSYQYFWRYQYRGRRFVLVHEEEQHPPSIY